MRAFVMLVLATCAVAGCYRSHALPIPIDAPPPMDAPTCQASCAAPTLLARIEREPDDAFFVSPTITVRDGVALVLVGFQTSGAPGRRYRLIRISVEDGALLGSADIPIEEPPDFLGLMGSHLSGPLDALVLTWVEAPNFRRGLSWRAALRQQQLDAVGAPLPTVNELGLLPQRHARVDSGEPFARALGRERAEVVVAIEGPDVGVTRVDPSGAIGPLSVLARIEDAPPGNAPVDAVLLGDRIAVAVGGFVEGREARAPYLVVEHGSGEVEIERLPGERFDPPTELVSSGEGFGLFRITSNPRDVADTRIVAQARDAEGVILDALEVRPAFGLTPLGVATIDLEGTPALVWLERDGTLRVLPPAGSGAVATWSTCDGVATTPVLTVTTLIGADAAGPVAAAGVNDGSGDIVVLLATASIDAGRERQAFELYRVSGCRLDAAF